MSVSIVVMFRLYELLWWSIMQRIGMEEIRVTYSHFLSFCHPCTLSLCKKIRFRTYLRDRTKENSFSFAWITSYNDRTTKKWLYVTDVTAWLCEWLVFLPFLMFLMGKSFEKHRWIKIISVFIEIFFAKDEFHRMNLWLKTQSVSNMIDPVYRNLF